MLIVMSCSSSRFVKTSLVNCAPWSVLKISGRVVVNAQSSAATQKALSNEIDTSHASTYRLNQSMIATR